MNQKRREEIRCPGCSRLLGLRAGDQGVDIVAGDRSRITLRSGAIACARCGSVVEVRPVDRREIVVGAVFVGPARPPRE